VKPGTVLHYSGFQFKDGVRGDKFLVVLNEGLCGFYVLVKTTSRQNGRSARYGCNLSDRYPNFFLQDGIPIFCAPTWVCLDDFYTHPVAEILTGKFSGIVTMKGELSVEIAKGLLLCAAASDDITAVQETQVRLALETHFP
jgi:hypothetical protein